MDNQIKITTQKPPEPLPLKSHKTQIVAGVILVMAIIAGGLLWWNFKKTSQPNPPVGTVNPTPTPVPTATIIKTSEGSVSQAWLEEQKKFDDDRELNKQPQKVEAVQKLSIPTNFPAGIPLENVSEADVLENKFETYYGGTVGLRTYFSSKTVAENYDLFKKYFTDNSWAVKEDTKNTQNQKQFFASAGKLKATVGVALDAATNKVKVTIYISETK